MAQPRADYDSPWKEIIEYFFPHFMVFFFPRIAEEIDWKQPYEFLDKELQSVVRSAEIGRHTVDKLVKVSRKDGKEAWLLIHIEVQSQVDEHFARRMFVSNYRLFDRYGIPVISLGVLADGQADWRPHSFGYGDWGSEMRLQFPTVKLLDYGPDWDHLLKNPNPFAVVVMAHLKAQATRRKNRERLQWKINLVRGLYERNYKRKEIYEIIRFVDWVLALPAEQEEIFRVELYKIEESDKMRYVTSFERLAMQEGLEQGIEQGLEQGTLLSARESVLDVLALRFSAVPQELITAINKIVDRQHLKALHRNAVLTGSLEDFERLFE